MAPKAPPYTFFALFAIVFLVIFNYTLTLMGSVYIVGDLGGSNYMTTYVISFYAIGNALGVPLGRSLSGRVGTVRLLTWCLLLFALISYFCAISPNYPVFIGARFLQGLVSGPFYTLTNRLFTYFTPEEKKEKSTAIMLTILTVGPVAGATFGGWMAYELNWRIVFYLNIPPTLLLAYFVYIRLRHYNAPKEKYSFDFIGYIFYFFGVFLLGFVLITGQEFDWHRSPLIVFFSVLGTLSMTFFVLWSRYQEHPVLEFKFFKNIGFAFGLLNLALLFSIYFGTVVLLSLWLSLYVNYTPVWVGLLIGNMLIAGILPTFMIKKLALVDCRIPLIVAITLLAISCFHTSIFNVEINFGRIAFSRVLAGFGLAFFLPPIFRLCFRSLEEDKVIDVVVLFQFVRALSSGLGVSLFVILWQRREIFYHQRLGGDLTPFSEKTKAFFVHAKGFNLDGIQSLAKLDDLLSRASIALALDDCFFFMGWLLVALAGVIVATLFLNKSSFLPEKK